MNAFAIKQIARKDLFEKTDSDEFQLYSANYWTCQRIRITTIIVLRERSSVLVGVLTSGKTFITASYMWDVMTRLSSHQSGLFSVECRVTWYAPVLQNGGVATDWARIWLLLWKSIEIMLMNGFIAKNGWCYRGWTSVICNGCPLTWVGDLGCSRVGPWVCVACFTSGVSSTTYRTGCECAGLSMVNVVHA